MSNPITRIKREHPDIADALDGQGWEMRLTNNGHVRCISPEGESVFTSGTPSDIRSDKNFRAQLQRAGLSLELVREQRGGAKMEAKDEGIEYWSGGKAAIYLGCSAQELREWVTTGVLSAAVNPPKRRGRPGLTFFSSTIIEFKESDTYRLLHKEHRTRKSDPIEIESLRIVVARRSMEELTPRELAEALGDAMKPLIEEAVRDVLTALMRKALA